jgi:hypothetical protein
MELAMGKKRRWWIQYNTYKCLPLILIDYHSKGDFDRKSSSAQFEENGRALMDITESSV